MTWEVRGLTDADVGRIQWLAVPKGSWSQLLSASRAPFKVLLRHLDKEMSQSSEMRVWLHPCLLALRRLGSRPLPPLTVGRLAFGFL